MKTFSDDVIESYFLSFSIQETLAYFGLAYTEPPVPVLEFQQEFLKQRKMCLELNIDFWRDNELGKRSTKVLNDFLAAQVRRTYSLCGLDEDDPTAGFDAELDALFDKEEENKE